ncbi:sporulation protein YpjB [Virgibacillus senegalensis]|uniref:sporulation protein YpjB n=1 Tax=Virgibacillus senegalensis TaxID=1499679 RepID=UPI00069ED7F9|nr:sporulation protein YpjB [Virgibacillus senegalensis]
MNRTRYLLLFLVFLLALGAFFPFFSVYAHHQDVHSSIYQYVRYIQEERYTEAENLLNQHSREFVEYAAGRTENMDMVEDVLERNLQTVATPSEEKSQKYSHAMSLLLVYDALRKGDEPLWLTWKKEIQKELDILANRENPPAKEDINRLAIRWNIVEPALKLVGEEEAYFETSAAIHYLLASADSPSWKEQLITASGKLQQIEIGEEETLKKNLTLIFMVAAVGGFIIITLSYVAWKKYKGERESRENKSENS